MHFPAVIKIILLHRLWRVHNNYCIVPAFFLLSAEVTAASLQPILQMVQYLNYSFLFLVFTSALVILSIILANDEFYNMHMLFSVHHYFQNLMPRTFLITNSTLCAFFLINFHRTMGDCTCRTASVTLPAADTAHSDAVLVFHSVCSFLVGGIKYLLFQLNIFQIPQLKMYAHL